MSRGFSAFSRPFSAVRKLRFAFTRVELLRISEEGAVWGQNGRLRVAQFSGLISGTAAWGREFRGLARVLCIRKLGHSRGGGSEFRNRGCGEVADLELQAVIVELFVVHRRFCNCT